MSHKPSQQAVSTPLEQSSVASRFPSGSSGRNLLHRSGLFAVRCLDRFLRYRLQIHEFRDQPDCLLRISKSRSNGFVTLEDGCEIKSGDTLLELHLWNEHLSLVGDPIHAFAWGLRLLKLLRFSLMLLADHVEAEPEWADIKAVHACFVTCLQRPEQILRHLGFSITPPPRSAGRKIHDYFENYLVYALIWAFHPCGIRRRQKDLKRIDLWLSKSSLLKIYGSPSLNSTSRICMVSDSFHDTSSLSKDSEREITLRHN